MIILCTKCMRGLRVTGDSDEIQYLLGENSDYWPDKYTCFHCGQQGIHALWEPQVDAPVIQAADIIDVGPQEAFAALNGLGIPSEKNCCSEVINAIFSEHNISVCGRQQRGSMLFYIDYLEMKDGTRVYFAPSPGGAVIYRIRPPHSYVGAAQ